METDLDIIRVQLNYPQSIVDKPILYWLITKFGLEPNIRRANMNLQDGGYLFLELRGTQTNLDNALEWLTDIGIEVDAIGLDGAEEWAV